MIVYIFEFIAILFLGIMMTMQPKAKRRYLDYYKYYLLISGIILAVILGGRGLNVGEDTIGYRLIANASMKMSWKQILGGFPRTIWRITNYGGGIVVESKIETGYLALNKLIMQLFKNPVMVQMVCSFLICFLFIEFIKDNSDNITMSMMTFIGESLYMNAFNLQRQMLAMAIAVNAYTLIKENKYKKALIVILSASMFHTSALMYVVMFVPAFVKNYQRGVRITVLSVLSSLLLVNVLLKIIALIFPIYTAYTQNSYWSVGIGKTVIVWLIEIMIVIIMYLKGIKGKSDFFYIYMITIYLGIEVLSLRFSAFGRGALLFRAFLILFFPAMIKYINCYKIKLLYFFSMMGIFILQYWSAINADSRIYSFYL